MTSSYENFKEFERQKKKEEHAARMILITTKKTKSEAQQKLESLKNSLLIENKREIK